MTNNIRNIGVQNIGIILNVLGLLIILLTLLMSSLTTPMTSIYFLVWVGSVIWAFGIGLRTAGVFGGRV